MNFHFINHSNTNLENYETGGYKIKHKSYNKQSAAVFVLGYLVHKDNKKWKYYPTATNFGGNHSDTVITRLNMLKGYQKLWMHDPSRIEGNIAATVSVCNMMTNLDM